MRFCPASKLTSWPATFYGWFQKTWYLCGINNGKFSIHKTVSSQSISIFTWFFKSLYPQDNAEGWMSLAHKMYCTVLQERNPDLRNQNLFLVTAGFPSLCPGRRPCLNYSQHWRCLCFALERDTISFKVVGKHIFCSEGRKWLYHQSCSLYKYFEYIVKKKSLHVTHKTCRNKREQ